MCLIECTGCIQEHIKEECDFEASEARIKGWSTTSGIPKTVGKEAQRKNTKEVSNNLSRSIYMIKSINKHLFHLKTCYSTSV